MFSNGWKSAAIVMLVSTMIAVGIPTLDRDPGFPGSACAAAPAALESLGEAFVQVAERVSPVVVNISSSRKVSGLFGKDKDQLPKNHPFREFFGDDFFKRFFPEGQRPVQGMGSGFIISEDGVIVTNSHVIRDADEIKVNLADKKSYIAKVLGQDTESDLAVIKIDAKGLPTVKFGDSDKMRVGEIVLAVGNPFGLNRTVTHGIVSAKGRTNVGIIEYEDFIQTDAAINPGNSGGPLLNIQGEVIGINTAIATRSGGYQGVGFAIPSTAAQAIIEQLRTEGKVRRGLLGVNIQNLDEALSKSYGRDNADGALVSQVIKDTVADKAGIKPGDIIVYFNGIPIKSAPELKNIVGKVKPGAKSVVTVIRDKKPMKIEVVVGERDPKKIAAMKEGGEEGESELGPSGQSASELGITVEKVPARVAEASGLKPGNGLMVKDLSDDGVGRKMGLKSGDIIIEVDDKTISDVEQFSAAVAKAKKNKVIRLKVKRGKLAPMYLAEKLD